MIKKILIILSIFFCGTAFASNTATQKITIKVEAINEISVSGDPEVFLISDSKTSAADDSTTYAMTINETNKKITATIDKELPKGLTLTVYLDPPEGAVSNEVALSPRPQDVVSRINPIAAKDMKIHYTLTVDEELPEIAESSVNVIFTIVDG